MKKVYIFTNLFLLLSLYLLTPLSLHADDKISLSDGQTIYVPVYSHIYIGNRKKPFPLTATLSIRNIDPKYRIKITAVDYYGSQGKLLKKYVDKPATLNPLESLEYIIAEKEERGGAGANFIVKWKSDQLVNSPIVESVMVEHRGYFTSRGRVIITPK